MAGKKSKLPALKPPDPILESPWCSPRWRRVSIHFQRLVLRGMVDLPLELPALVFRVPYEARRGHPEDEEGSLLVPAALGGAMEAFFTWFDVPVGNVFLAPLLLRVMVSFAELVPPGGWQTVTAVERLDSVLRIFLPACPYGNLFLWRRAITDAYLEGSIAQCLMAVARQTLDRCYRKPTHEGEAPGWPPTEVTIEKGNIFMNWRDDSGKLVLTLKVLQTGVGVIFARPDGYSLGAPTLGGRRLDGKVSDEDLWVQVYQHLLLEGAVCPDFA